MSLERIDDSIDLAKEFALELRLQRDSISPEQIKDTLNLLNGLQDFSGNQTPSIIHAKEAYIDPPEMNTIYNFSQHQLDKVRIEEATIAGSTFAFRWLGANATKGFFGVHMFDADILTPLEVSAQNVLIPVDAVGFES